MWQVGSTCYSTELAANQAAASGQLGAVVSHGGSAYVTSVQAVTSTGITYALAPINGGAPLTATIAVTPQPCGLLTHTDALDLGWKVAIVWIAVYAVSYLARAAIININGGSNDT